MNALIITSTFPRNIHDNQVPWLAKLIRQLKKKGVNPTIYAPAYQGLTSHKYFSIPVIRFRYAPAFFEILTHEEGALFKLRQKPWLTIVALFYLFFGMIGIIRLRQNVKLDIVHVHWPFPNGLFGIIAKKLFHAKLIVTFHGAEFSLLRRVPFGKTILRLILKNSDTIVANSSFTKKMIQAVDKVEVSIVPFSSAVSVGREQKEIIDESKKTLKVLFVGRFIERKGIPYLIEAVRLLRRKNIPITLDIVGKGPLTKEIKKQIKHFNLVGVVRVHENVSETSLPNFYKRCDVFVLPSIVDKWNDTEGLGVVLIEAMSFGKPIVASRVGGIPDVVKHNVTGFLVEEKNPEALVGALKTLYLRPMLRKQFGNRGLSYVKKYYDWNSILDKTMELYRQT